MIRLVRIERISSTDSGTFGTLITDSGFTCRTGELPWRNNLPFKSCIPTGVYPCYWGTSPKHGDCYHVQRVPGRTDVEIHAANYMGNVDLGFRSELSGCIAVGAGVHTLNNQLALFSSRNVLSDLELHLGCEEFLLTIVDAGHQNGFSA